MTRGSGARPPAGQRQVTGQRQSRASRESTQNRSARTVRKKTQPSRAVRDGTATRQRSQAPSKTRAGRRPAPPTAGQPEGAVRKAQSTRRAEPVRKKAPQKRPQAAPRNRSQAAPRMRPQAAPRNQSQPASQKRPQPAPPRPARRPRRPPRTVRLADPKRRLHVSLLMVFVALSLLSGRLVQLQGLDASTYAEMARDSRTQVVAVPAARGPILDRNGQPLAKSVEAYDVVVDQVLIREHGNVAAYALQLEGLLDDDATSIQRNLTGDRRYKVLARRVTPQTWRAISELGLTGIYREPTLQRIYPAGAVAGNVVGFVGAEGAGLAGLEQSRQEQLAGVDGELVYQVARGGVRIPLGSGRRDEAVPGEGVRLTLDRDLQWFAEEVVAEQVERAKAVGGNVVVMDARTGEVVAMATAPGLDPNDPARTSGDGGGNRVVEDAYEPGSVLKPLSLAAVIEEGLAGPDTMFSVADNITRADLTIRDHYNHPEQQMTMTGILAKSSNVGTILATERLTPDVFGDYLSRFGLGVRPNLGLPAETPGRLPREWAALDRDFASFGQGISLNTMQLASAYATIANGGVRTPPRLIDATIDADGREAPVPAAQPERVISESTADAVTAMLEAVMGPDGTGSAISVDGYRVAGKTGTAQRIDPGCGCYSGKVDVSFIGFAPAEDPRYVVAVTIFDPKQGRSGGGLGGPVFADVMGFTLARMGVAPSAGEPPELALFAE